MRVSNVVLGFLLLFGQKVSGQFDDKYGRITPGDVDMKECSFDPGANAVILINEAATEYNVFHEAVTHYHVRIKILKESGVNRANFSIIYRSRKNYVVIDELEAITINITKDGERTEFPINKKAIYDKKISNKYSSISFAFPEVKMGSILEYKYRRTVRGYGGLDDWEFQQKLPVCFSSYQLKSPPGIEVSYAFQKRPEYQVYIKPSPKDQLIYFEMKNISGLDDEPYMESRETCVQKVMFQITKYLGYDGIESFMSSWNEVTDWLFKFDKFGKQINTRLPDVEAGIQNSLKDKDDVQKMKIIYDYVHKNLEWNGADAVYSQDGLKELWLKKTGSSGSINLMLINLLKVFNLEAYPMLVSERGNGKINTAYPYIDQFNNVYAVVYINDRKYFLDATNSYTPATVIPYDILNTTAFIVDNKAGGLVKIEEKDVRFRENILIDANLGNDGKLTANVQRIDKEYARIQKLKTYNSDGKSYVDKNVKNTFGNMEVDSFSFVSKDSNLVNENFRVTYYIQNTGEYAFVTLNMFTGFEKNPFVANNRFSDIDFGNNSTTNLNYVLNLPDSLSVDAIPKNIQLTNYDKSVVFVRTVNYNEQSRLLSARIKIEINKSVYSVDEYGEIKEFYKKMIDLLNEPVVLKKKK